jgi:HAD superfamily phosphatase (TIGR01668 family)
LVSQKINLLILDVNNTLVEKSQFTLPDEHKVWLEACLQKDIQIVLCSNNPSSLVKTFAQTHQLKVVRFSMKPFTFRIKAYLRQHQLMHRPMMVIGDQLFTDVLLGKWLKVQTALVQPLSTKDHLTTKFIRKIEAHLLKHAKR